MRFTISKLFLLYIILFSIGCNPEEKTPTKNQEQVSLDSLSTKKVDYQLTSLTPESKKEYVDNEDINTLKNLMVTINQSNPFHIRKYADSLDTSIQTFKEGISTDLNSEAISSRILVMTTRSGMLSQEASRINPNPENLLEKAKKVLEAYNSFIVQLNERTLAIPENIEKELLREITIEKDSIPSEILEEIEDE